MTKFMNQLQIPCMDNKDKATVDEWMGNEEISLKPPFVVSYYSLLIGAGLGDKQQATTEMVNKWHTKTVSPYWTLPRTQK